MSRRIRKATICICKNKGADELCSNCTADQRLCFRYSDNTISLLLKSKVSSVKLSSDTVRLDCVGPGRKPKLLIFSRDCSIIMNTQGLMLRDFCGLMISASESGLRGWGFELHRPLVMSLDEKHKLTIVLNNVNTALQFAQILAWGFKNLQIILK